MRKGRSLSYSRTPKGFSRKPYWSNTRTPYNGDMKPMADLTFRDRLPDYRNEYNRLKSKDAKTRFIDRLQET